MKKVPVWIWVVPLVIILGLGAVSVSVWKSVLADTYAEEQSRLINRASVLISKELGFMQQIVEYLREELETIPQENFASEADWRRAVEEQFRQTRHLSDNISQLRWLSPTGQEWVRVNVNSREDTTAIPLEELQDKSSRYYFIKGSQLSLGEVLITPTDLNVEHGLIVEPYEATTRAVTKLESPQGTWEGLLVVNFNVNRVLEQLRAMQTLSNTLQVVDSQGNWLLSYRPEREWRHLYGDYSVAMPQLYPDAWQRIIERRALATESLEGLPATVTPGYIDSASQLPPRTYLISKVRPDMWLKDQYTIYIVVVALACLMYATTVALLLLRWRLAKQRSAYLERIRLDKARVEKAYSILKDTNKNLVMLQKELVEQSKLSALGMLVAGVGHELNTPLGGLRMTLSSITNHIKRIKQAEDPLSEKQAKHLDLIKQTLDIAESNLDRAVGVVEQFKRITDSRTQQTLQNFKVGLVLEDTLAALKPLRKLHPNVEVSMQGDPDLEFCSTAGVVSQVLQSLITNALDHAFPNQASGEITIAFSKEEHYVIEIRDNGKGIDEAILPAIWEPFVTTGRGGKHTGLGLFMVHQWVTELLRGQITVEQNTPHGARFTILIPLPKEAKKSQPIGH